VKAISLYITQFHRYSAFKMCFFEATLHKYIQQQQQIGRIHLRQSISVTHSFYDKQKKNS